VKEIVGGGRRRVLPAMLRMSGLQQRACVEVLPRE
jgi:hypothetical protein